MSKAFKNIGRIFEKKPLGQRNMYEIAGSYTGDSSAVKGKVNIDPSIRAIQDKGLNRIDELYAQSGAYGNELMGNSRWLRTQTQGRYDQLRGDTQSRYKELLGNNSGLRGRYMGNQSDYANAQLNPLRQQIATGRGELQKNIGLRGISGSSFGNQAMTSYDAETGRNLQDAGANVENQQLQAMQGIDEQRGQFVSQEMQQRAQQAGQELQAITGIDANMTQQMFTTIAQQSQLNGESQDIGRQRLQQELAALGLGAAQTKAMQDSFDKYLERDLERRKMFSQGISNTFGTTMGRTGGSSGGPT